MRRTLLPSGRDRTAPARWPARGGRRPASGATAQRLCRRHLPVVQRGRANPVVVARPAHGVPHRGRAPVQPLPPPVARQHVGDHRRHRFQSCDACLRRSTATGQDGTWISPAMVEAYGQLHDLGFAHSFEVWDRQTLVGGIYGVAIGSMFFGESMFSGASGLQGRAPRYGHAWRLGLAADRCPGGESTPAADGRHASAARRFWITCAWRCATRAVKARGRRRWDDCRLGVSPGLTQTLQAGPVTRKIPRLRPSVAVF